MTVMQFLAYSIAFIAGGVVVLTVTSVRKFFQKQIDDVKTHIPGA